MVHLYFVVVYTYEVGSQTRNCKLRYHVFLFLIPLYELVGMMFASSSYELLETVKIKPQDVL